MVRVISANRVDENDRVPATPFSRMVLWLGIGRFSRETKVLESRARASTRSLTQIRTDVHASCNLALIFRVCAITRDPFPSER